MSRAIVMSIQPQFADAILAGRKDAEFRTYPCGVDVTTGAQPDRVFIYRSGDAGQRGIVGWFTVAGIVPGSPVEHFAAVAQPGISLADLEAYARHRQVWRFDVGKVVALPEVVPLSVLGWRRPPQSWRYLKREQAAALMATLGRGAAQ